MCDVCGCGDTEIVPVHIHEDILSGNRHQAEHNRAHFEEAGVTALNLMGSPGSGKTAIIEATARWLGPGRKIAAVSGDLATERDAERLRAAGIRSTTITTGSACHLDAQMVHHALHHVDWRGNDFFFIENVGNLVCPALYDLGQGANIVVLSVTEGEDKPLKYPPMFRTADLVLLSKVDLLPHLPEVSTDAIEDALARVMPEPRMIPISAASGQGAEEWVAYLEQFRAQRSLRESVPRSGEPTSSGTALR